MEVYSTDEERIEAIKRWFAQYGKSLAFGIILAVVVIFGWRYWQNKQLNLAYQASNIYSEIITSFAEEKPEFVAQQADYLTQNYANTAYATLAQFIVAKQKVTEKKYSDAITHLQWIIDHSDHAHFKDLARVRAARVHLQQKQPKQALALLDQVNDDGFVAYAAIVQGDAYQSMGKASEAKRAYQKAVDTLNPNEPLRGLVKMKLDNIV